MLTAKNQIKTKVTLSQLPEETRLKLHRAMPQMLIAKTQAENKKTPPPPAVRADQGQAA